MPTQPSQSANSVSNHEFLARYEQDVNRNLRNFGELEGQIGMNSLEGAQQSCHKQKKSTSKTKIGLCCLSLVFIVLLVALGVVWTSNAGQTKAKSTAPDAESRVPTSSTADATRTSAIISSSSGSSLLSSTSSYRPTTPASSSGSTALTGSISTSTHGTSAASETFPTDSATSSSEPAKKSPSTTIKPKTSTKATTSSEPTLTGGPLGFCGAPGNPCRRRRNIQHHSYPGILDIVSPDEIPTSPLPSTTPDLDVVTVIYTTIATSYDMVPASSSSQPQTAAKSQSSAPSGIPVSSSPATSLTETSESTSSENSATVSFSSTHLPPTTISTSSTASASQISSPTSSSPTTPTIVSKKAMWGFCGPPGSPCLRLRHD